MKDYIKKTLDAISAEIAELEELRKGLERHFEKGVVDQAPAEKPVRAVSKREAKKASRKPSAKVKEKDLSGSDGEDGPVRIGSLQHRTLVEGRKMPDPFSAEKIATALGIDKTYSHLL